MIIEVEADIAKDYNLYEITCPHCKETQIVSTACIILCDCGEPYKITMDMINYET